MTYSHVIFALLILSTFGYVNFCRMKWRMTFTMGVFFVVSCQILLIMASGFRMMETNRQEFNGKFFQKKI